MADQKKSMKEQRDSIVDAYNNPQPTSMDPTDMLAKLKAAVGGDPSAAAPEADPANPGPAMQAMNQQAADYAGQVGDDHIAQMQQANLAQAQNDPAMAAKLAAVQEAIKRQQAAQMAKLQGIPSVQQQIGGKIGQTFPAQE